MAVEIRKAQDRDVGLIVRGRVAALRSVRGASWDPPADFADRTLAWVESEAGAGRFHSWVAEDADVFVGVVSLLLWPRPPRPDDHRTTEGYIVNMFVDPERQRAGIGRRLLDACTSAADEFGVRKFMLHSSEAGRHLYETSGFESRSEFMELLV